LATRLYDAQCRHLAHVEQGFGGRHVSCGI
jgi:hypothetical protein